MKLICALAVVGYALAGFAPTTLMAPEMGFKLNVVKNSESLTGCPESPAGAYTVVSLLRTDKERTRILNPYVVKLLMQCQVQEVHTWDLYAKEDGHLAGEMDGFDERVPEMLKLYSDWRQRYVKSKFANFYSKYQVPDRKRAVLLKLDDSVLYMDIGKFGQAASYAMDHPENFLALPNMVSDSSASGNAFHQECMPDSDREQWMLLTKDRKTAVTQRSFLQNPSCFNLKDFNLKETDQCVGLDSGADNRATPTGAYLVHFTNMEDLSKVLKNSVGDETALFGDGTAGSARKACILTTSTMASIVPSNKQSTEIYMPVYKMLSQKIQAGSRITDDKLAEDILRANGLELGIPKKQLELMAKSEASAAEPTMCPRVRSYVDLSQCQAPQKVHMKWLQLKETSPAECTRPCSEAPLEFQHASFISEEDKVALFTSPKLNKPLSELFQTRLNNMEAANPEKSYEAKDYKVVVSAHEPLHGFAQTFTNFMKSMKQIGVDKTSLKQTIAHCKATPQEDGCKSLLTEKLPVLQKWIDLDAFDHSADNVTASLLQSTFKDINRLVYPGCEAQLGAGTTPQLAAFLPSYLTIQAKKTFHVLREEYAEEDLNDLFQKLGMEASQAKIVSSLSEFGYMSDMKSDGSVGAEDLKNDLKSAMALLEQKESDTEGFKRDTTIKAIKEIQRDVDARVHYDSQIELVKSLIKESPELTKSFCSIYSMDYSCLGYGQEFENICGAVEGPAKVSMKKEFILKLSTPKSKLALRRKASEGLRSLRMRRMEQRACLTKDSSPLSFMAFVDTVDNCQAHCEGKKDCKTYNYDTASRGCSLYSSPPMFASKEQFSTCGTVCRDNDKGLEMLASQRGLDSLGVHCKNAAEYCGHEDVALMCASTCDKCTKLEL